MLEDFFENYFKIEKAYRKYFQDEMEKYHLTPNELLVLLFLARDNGGCNTARDIAQYVVVAQRYQRLTDRALAAAVFFHQCFFIQHLVGPVLLGNDAFQDRVIDGVLEAVLALHGRLLLCGGSVSGPGLW